jgi:hypothetical protein
MDVKTEPVEDRKEKIESDEALSFADDREEYEYLLGQFDAKRQKQLLRKVDLHLLPILAVFYLLSFMDRSNIGNARLQGLEDDLKLTPGQYNW